jgi:hypothetical protein
MEGKPMIEISVEQSQKKYPTAKEIIAKVAKAQIEQKYGSVANAITELCQSQKDKV